MSIKPSPFECFLFSIDEETIIEAIQSGVDGIIVDLESKNKFIRQQNYDTQINSYTLQDLEKVRRFGGFHLISRINNSSNFDDIKSEVDHVINLGTDEILLPMVRNTEEVEQILSYINNRAALSIMIETKDAVLNTSKFDQFNLARVYLGLNDLAIDTGSQNIFNALLKGTVDQVRLNTIHRFGFAGLTHPALGAPIPCRLLVSEMARLQCNFTFLRRSFLKDTSIEKFRSTIFEIKHALKYANQYSYEQLEQNRIELYELINKTQFNFQHVNN